MCLIFNRDLDGGRIDWDLLRRGFNRNPDGAGVLYWSFGRWEVVKGDNWTWGELRDVLTDVDRFGGPWAVHMRYRTVGPVNPDNCHPFDLGSGGWLMHNGTLDLRPVGLESDSATLARRVRQGRVTIAEAADCALRSRSRLLVAHGDGRVELVGEWFRRSAGWFSNARLMARAGRGVVFA